MFFAWLPRFPKRYPNPVAAFAIIDQAIDAWSQDGEKIERLPKFFDTRPDGKFTLAPLNKLIAGKASI